MLLDDQIEKQFRINDIQKKALKKIGLQTLNDLLFYFPSRYNDISNMKKISDLTVGETATICGKVLKTASKKGFKSKIPMGEAEIDDGSGKLKVIWFSQAYMAKMMKVGQIVKLTGRITEGKRGMYLANPEFEKAGDMPIDYHSSLFAPQEAGQAKDRFSNGIYPIYPETRGITSRWIFHTIQKIISSGLVTEIKEYTPEEILKRYNLPGLRSALIWIHFPKKERDATAARKRFAFDEVFFLQLERAGDRMKYEKSAGFKITPSKKEIGEFVNRFPFKMTPAQDRAISQILNDFEKESPMSRLLEGDVGSGKTAVAATASYATIRSRPPKTPDGQVFGRPSALADDLDRGKLQTFGSLQVAYMAPTEILASQHFENFIKYFEHLNISVALITGSGCKKFPSKVYNPANGGINWTNISRPQLLKWIASGEIPILIGTHALIQKSVKFKNLALVIIDEQHRFGVNQRFALAKGKSDTAPIPHLLSMIATPIPRTLALTVYGDLDLTLLDEMPVGRKPIITEIVTPNKRDATYEKIKEELVKGRQLYVICPRINEPDPEKELALNVKSAVAEAKRLKKDIFPKYEIGVLHSKMTKQKKEEEMKDFYEGNIDILVATSVVEVGVNVPNATIIIIEGGERFGLSQLHQLRGRVIRSSHQAYCYVFASDSAKATSSKGGKNKTIDRFSAFKTAKNGFELSELDLALRGAGELYGSKQWGLSDLGMEAIKNLKMVEAARTEAKILIQKDPELSKHPLLKAKIKEKAGEFHFE